MFAVIKTGGKQYIVRENQSLKIEKVPGQKGDSIEFEVLLRAEEDGSAIEIGKPTLSGSVKGEIEDHGKGPKIEVVKYKAKSRYTRKTGHRQPYTQVKIGKV